jgi:hypothetical protein
MFLLQVTLLLVVVVAIDIDAGLSTLEVDVDRAIRHGIAAKAATVIIEGRGEVVEVGSGA